MRSFEDNPREAIALRGSPRATTPPAMTEVERRVEEFIWKILGLSVVGAEHRAAAPSAP
jgi:hypothetical protein